jgi:hypothetical protein
MKYFLTIIMLCVMTSLSYAQEGGRSPAGGKSGNDGPKGNQGGGSGGKDKQSSKSEKSKDKATYEKDRSKAADRGNPNIGNPATDNLGNDGKTGGPTPSGNPRGTNTGDKGTQSEAIKENDKTQNGRDKNNSEGVTDADRNPASSKAAPGAKDKDNGPEPAGGRNVDARSKDKKQEEAKKPDNKGIKPPKIKIPKVRF